MSYKIELNIEPYQVDVLLNALTEYAYSEEDRAQAELSKIDRSRTQNGKAGIALRAQGHTNNAHYARKMYTQIRLYLDEHEPDWNALPFN